MDKKMLLSPLRQSLEYHQLLDRVNLEKTPVAIHGLNDSQKGHMSYGLFDDSNEQVCILTYSEVEARKIEQDLKFYIGDRGLFFPSREVIFYDLKAQTDHAQQERMETLQKIATGEKHVVVASIESLLLKLIPPALYKKDQISFKVGESIDLEKVTETFVKQGYERVEQVEGNGQFSIRGGIIDIYSGGEISPYRIELFDDEVDSIRQFQVDTQRSTQKVQELLIYPVAETIIEPSAVESVIQAIEAEGAALSKKLKGGPKERLAEKVAEVSNKFREFGHFNGVEQYAPYLYEQEASLLDYLNPNALVIIDEPQRCKERVRGYEGEFKENFKTLLERGEVLPTQGNLLLAYDKLVKSVLERRVITLSLLPKNTPDFPPKEIINFMARPVQSFHGKINLLIDELKSLQYKGYKIVLLPGTKERALRLLELLRERGIPVEFVVSHKEEIVSGQIFIMQGSINRGFEYSSMKYMTITDYEIYGVHKRKKKERRRKDAVSIKSFVDLQVGDHVVHEGHGIGKYIGIEELSVEGIKKDYIKIRYSGEDHLYVPTDQMNLIQKYIGSDKGSPKLNKLGGVEWVKTKGKVKKAIEDMAEELLKLYAERRRNKGHAFGNDGEWQKQFEDLFPYEETPDQLKSIEEVKADMEQEGAMDRLLCGDVGYGKTEVAIRAGFKAVMDSKQVAFLVPTTILAQQHFNNFKQRFSGFPVTVEMLSRFKTPAQQKQVLEGVRTGNVDVLIGTHRLLSKDIEFKDLGLLIVDEEQRFGVKHKERMKQMKESIDVLTLTATPIPRTLHMSMVGIRDMSVIEDPPEERFPVQTYVIPYNESMIIDAITKEMARGGQTYYVYNRVDGIHQVARKLQELIPEARVAVGHGQMGERELEMLMMDYLDGVYDVLVCTTIIETGLDISNVNTIMIHDADKLGLSQLYQLRGRVGRSSQQGYAYLMYQRDKILSEVAEKRLKAIKEFTEFGSGFKIAMRDLEIRGAGNLLGSQQHGHMASIGYDLYIKLLEETMAEMKGEVVEKYEDTNMELNVNAYIPERFIGSSTHKIEIYKKIASIRNQEDLYAIEEEIEDRFGDIPMSVRNLLMISYIKALGNQIRVQTITQKEKEIRIQFTRSQKLKPENIGSVLHQYPRKVSFHGSDQPYLIYQIRTADQYKLLTEIKEVIEKISGFHNEADSV
ncbi:transcription-repair coupling factor [Alkaliphilus metalliredigens QYMF]|uniref:Transcription-repair-coupling factor n=1 Tax=Alkaliphilus metalliredigens (strain QYMF) TaxID=293826 RepID=A6TJM9_ALKMQ|nr:transcription-repair coupling factor [Alkaliphilus metalliredigens]ABR46397.1 transcription-repair coupling factor [Alkaliphilus metalliredigens QYMF]